MGFFNFVYDLFVFLTTHYSELPDSFKRSFPESRLVNGRIFFSDVRQAGISVFNDFEDYD